MTTFVDQGEVKQNKSSEVFFHFIRHGQTIGYLGKKITKQQRESFTNYNIMDDELTPLGTQQAKRDLCSIPFE